MLGIWTDNVVVREFAGSGHYGRSNGGNPGCEDKAVILSPAVGKPVRPQWMRAEDFRWSTQSPIEYSDVQIALDANGAMGLCLSGGGAAFDRQGQGDELHRRPGSGHRRQPASAEAAVEGGAVMGISHALHEDLTFRRERRDLARRADSSDPEMADLPAITLVLLDRTGARSYAQGSETANALAAPAIAAAVFDATGKVARRLPLKPANVQALLNA